MAGQGPPNLGGASGVFSWFAGQVALVADQSTPIPGGSGNFQAFFGTTTSGNQVAFNGVHDGSFASGIYLTSIGGGTIDIIADQSVPVPSHGGTFASYRFGTPALSGGSVAFAARPVSGPIYMGVFADLGTGLFRIADTTTQAPSGGLFTNFGTVSIDGDRVAFLANTQTGGQALYFYESGVIHRVIGQNDILPSGGVLGLSFSSEGLDGDTLAFRYNLAQNPPMGAIYTVTIPSPSTLLLLAAAPAFGRGRRVASGVV